MAGDLWTANLGVVEYREAWALQERVRAARQADAIPDTLLLLEHPPVYTRGRRSQPGGFAMGEEWYRMQGVDVVDVDRGGLLTYHGPGQLVGYPIMRVAASWPTCARWSRRSSPRSSMRACRRRAGAPTRVAS